MNRPKLSAFPVLAAATVAVVIYSPRDLVLNVVIAVALIGLYIILRRWAMTVTRPIPLSDGPSRSTGCATCNRG